jgi:hypothetical protein
MMLTDTIIPFSLGEACDSQGRRIEAIWNWDLEALGCTHNYIQWLFPLSESSNFNPEAPIVNEKVIQAFHRDSRLRHNLLRSLVVMLRFYG